MRGKKFEPFEVLCTDFTEIKYANGTRKVCLMAMLDPGSGRVVGWAVEKGADRELALRFWKMANLAGWGVGPEGLIVHPDQDSVYTGHRWPRQLLADLE